MFQNKARLIYISTITNGFTVKTNSNIVKAKNSSTITLLRTLINPVIVENSLGYEEYSIKEILSDNISFSVNKAITPLNGTTYEPLTEILNQTFDIYALSTFDDFINGRLYSDELTYVPYTIFKLQQLIEQPSTIEYTFNDNIIAGGSLYNVSANTIDVYTINNFYKKLTITRNGNYIDINLQSFYKSFPSIFLIDGTNITKLNDTLYISMISDVIKINIVTLKTAYPNKNFQIII